MRDDMKAFFEDSISSAQTKLDESSGLQDYLDNFTSTMGTSLSAAVDLTVEVKSSNNDLQMCLSRVRRKRLMPGRNWGIPRSICEPIEPRHYNLTVAENRSQREVFLYEPDPVAYFPVRIQYGDGAKELICTNAREVKSGMRAMAKDSLPAILRYLRQVKAKSGATR